MRNRTYRWMLSLILIIASFLNISSVKAFAATSPSYSDIKTSSITFNDATITATLKNPSKLKLVEAGFYIGEKSGKAIKEGTKKYDKISDKWQKAESLPCSYDLKDEYGLKLKADTKYYVVLYVKDSSDKTYYSAEISFTTAESIKYKDAKVKSVTSNNAVITATISNSAGVKITKGGFVVMSESGKALKNGTKTDNVTGKWQTASSVPCSYDLKNEYNFTLEAGKTYKIQLFCIDSHDNRYESKVITIETPKAKSSSNKISTNTDGGTNPPFYYNTSEETKKIASLICDDDTPEYIYACRLNSYAMIFQTLGLDATVKDLYDFNRKYDKYGVNVAATEAVGKAFGCIIGEGIYIDKSKDQEADLKKVLDKLPEGQQIIYISWPVHAAVAYLDESGKLKFNDPGTKDGEACSYSTITKQWGAIKNYRIVTVDE